MPHIESKTVTQEADETVEFNIADLIRSIWSIRGWLVAGAALGALIAVAAILVLRVSDFEKTTNYVIEFRFAGRDNNQYPNGTPFSLSDITAPAVLSSVYESENLSRYGMSYRDFQSAITVAPYSIERQKLIDQFSQIDARKATVAELREAQQQLERNLDAASKRYAVISFTGSGFSIPQPEVSKVLTDIAKAWEQNAIDVRGVVKLDLNAVQPKLFDPANLDGLERLNALRYLRDKLADLRGFVTKVDALPGGNLVSDQPTSLGTTGLLSALDRASVQLLEASSGWSNTVGNGPSETLGMPINLYSDRLFDPDQIKNLDYLIAIDLIGERIKLVRDNVTRIRASQFGDVVSDPETKLTAQDVSRLVDDLNNYSIKQLAAPVLSLGIAKNPQEVRLYYASRLQELRRDKETLVQKAQVLEQANRSYQGLMSGGTPSAADQSPSGQTPSSFPPANATVIPQFGDAFLDRIIQLSQRGGDQKFRQDLLQQTVDLQQQGADIDSEIARISDYIGAFSEGTAQPQDGDAKQSFTKQLDQQLPAAFEKLKTYAQVTERIAYRLRYAKDIFATNRGADESNNGLTADFFLRDVQPAQQVRIAEIATEVQGLAEVANRLYGQIGKQALGSYQTLFRSANDPTPVRTPLLDRFQLMILVLAIVAGLLIALVGVFFTRFVESDSYRRPKFKG